MEKHYVYGGGMVGCMYDFGPNFCENKKDAIESLVELYLGYLTDEDFSEIQSSYHYIRTFRSELEQEMRNVLAVSSIYYFPTSVRGLVGADYCEISECDGPCPEGDE